MTETHPYVVVKDCGHGRCWSRVYKSLDAAHDGLVRWQKEQPGGDWRIQYQPQGWAGPINLLHGSWGAPDNGWGGAML